MTSSIDHTYHLSFVTTRWAILRCLALIYWVAFTAAWNQNLGLIGEHGLQPAADYWTSLTEYYYKEVGKTAAWQGFLQHPCLFWWVPLSDATLNGISFMGIIIAGLATTGLYVSWISFALLWLIQISIVNVSAHTAFYGYGWESQLLETTVLAVFLCELPSLSLQKRTIHQKDNWHHKWKLHCHWALKNAATKKPQQVIQQQQPPSKIILWLFRWLSFRISLGAGLIKVRGSSCWTDKTCLWYHFETQPIPSPLSFIFHFLPRNILSQAVDLDLFVQLYTSWMVLIMMPTSCFGTTIQKTTTAMVRMGGMIQAGFMINIMLSGNFSFLNHLTIIPALACLDDACWPTWLERWIVPRREWGSGSGNSSGSYNRPAEVDDNNKTTTTTNRITIPSRRLVDALFFALIAFLSWPVITNLLQLGGTRQIMNGSFDNFRLVNTYGAFGSVGTERNGTKPSYPYLPTAGRGTNWNFLVNPVP